MKLPWTEKMLNTQFHLHSTVGDNSGPKLMSDLKLVGDLEADEVDMS